MWGQPPPAVRIANDLGGQQNTVKQGILELLNPEDTRLRLCLRD
jgi:hypothetical protein